jgi:hypothetical protein
MMVMNLRVPTFHDCHDCHAFQPGGGDPLIFKSQKKSVPFAAVKSMAVMAVMEDEGLHPPPRSGATVDGAGEARPAESRRCTRCTA